MTTAETNEQKSASKRAKALKDAVNEAVGKKPVAEPAVTVTGLSSAVAEEDGKRYLYKFRALNHTTFGVNFYAKGDILKRTVNELPHDNFEYIGKEEIIEQEEDFDSLKEAYKKSMMM